MTDDRIDVLSRRGADTVSSFINLIIQTTNKAGVHFPIPTLERSCTAEELTRMNEMIRNNRERLGALEGEYMGTTKVRYIYNGPEWFMVDMTWSRGMSNSVNRISWGVTEDLEPRPGIYNILVDMGIFSIHSVLKYCEQSMQELADANDRRLCIPKFVKEDEETGCESGQCRCGNIVHSTQKFCAECGAKLNW